MQLRAFRFSPFRISSVGAELESQDLRARPRASERRGAASSAARSLGSICHLLWRLTALAAPLEGSNAAGSERDKRIRKESRRIGRFGCGRRSQTWVLPVVGSHQSVTCSRLSRSLALSLSGERLKWARVRDSPIERNRVE